MQPTFILRRADGAAEQTQYHAVVVPMPDGTSLRLALHPVGPHGGWALSDPRSGYRVLTVRGSFRGITTSSVGMGMSEARRAARAQFLAMVDNVGQDLINKRFAEAAAAVESARPPVPGANKW